MSRCYNKEKMSELSVSIIIVNWNTHELLRACLNSINSFGIGAETIVVDNGSTDGSVQMVSDEFAWVRLIRNAENCGYARANNQAIKVCNRKFLLLLNSDAQLTDGALEKMVGCMEENDKIGICGPRLIYPDGRDQWSYGDLPVLLWEILGLIGVKRRKSLPRGTSRKSESDQPLSCRMIEAGMLSGASMMVRHQMFTEIGLLDERFFMFNEEVDLCKRALRAGWKVVYVPGAMVVHVGGGSTGVTAERILRLFKGKLQYYDKHQGEWACQRLWVAMWVSTRIKIMVYRLLKVVGKDKSDRARLWSEVSRGLAGVRNFSSQ